MGTYVNPGNRAFAEISSGNYVDKTGLISIINHTILKPDKLTCVSRPRRFGKSWAAGMLAAYYDSSCDSACLFDRMKIARTVEYRSFLNRFNVIYLDISGFVSELINSSGSLKDVPVLIKKAIWKDLLEEGFSSREDDTLNDFLLRCVNQPEGKPFVFIIDEWDAVIREARLDHAAQEAYLNLLRSWFKNSNFTPKAVAAAYMTGILPIKKDGSQSAISDFQEYTMLHPGPFAAYTGFSEVEVRELCIKNNMTFESVKSWYDGYNLSGSCGLYNPYSVMNAMKARTCRSFWGKTSAAEGLTDYIQMDFDGLQETVANLIAGLEVGVHTDGFQNDLESFGSKDDVLTLLIHLGYLTYDAARQTVRIPNEEVREEFRNFLAKDHTGLHWKRLIGRSNRILQDTIEGKADALAAALEEIHSEQYAPQYYNNEQSLRAVIKYAYLSAIGKYIRIDEMPSGKGIADVVFIPSMPSRLPALVIELKWNRTAEGAIAQIREKHYTAALLPFKGNIVLAGITYNEKTGTHTCVIEKA